MKALRCRSQFLILLLAVSETPLPVVAPGSGRCEFRHPDLGDHPVWCRCSVFRCQLWRRTSSSWGCVLIHFGPSGVVDVMPQSVAPDFREAGRPARPVGRDVKRLGGGQQQSVFTFEYVAKGHTSAQNLVERGPDGYEVIEGGCSAVADVESSDSQRDSRTLNLCVAYSSLAEPLYTRGLEPHSVGGVVGDPHLICLCEPHTNLDRRLATSHGSGSIPRLQSTQSGLRRLLLDLRV